MLLDHFGAPRRVRVVLHRNCVYFCSSEDLWRLYCCPSECCSAIVEPRAGDVGTQASSKVPRTRGQYRGTVQSRGSQTWRGLSSPLAGLSPGFHHHGALRRHCPRWREWVEVSVVTIKRPKIKLYERLETQRLRLLFALFVKKVLFYWYIKSCGN